MNGSSHAAAGYVLYHAASATYELTPEQAMVLANEDSPVFLPPAWEVPVSMWMDEDKTLEAFRTGQGIGWDQHDKRLFSGSAAFYRNGYRSHLVSRRFPPSKAWRRNSDPALAWQTLVAVMVIPQSLSPGISQITILGFRVSSGFFDAAQSNAQKSGVAERVTFSMATAKSYPAHGYDLICFFDCLHDMGDPVGVAEYARSALADDGTILLVEPFANDRVEDNLNTVGRLYYAASTTICCAHSLSEEVGTALGAQAGEARLVDVFRKAGFRKFRRAKATPFNLILEVKAGCTDSKSSP